MNRMWDIIIEPILHELDVNNIVEIGSDYGVNTRNILDYCVKYDKNMVAIDPNPKFDLDEFVKEYGDKFKLYADLSLDILPKLDNYDCVLIDGDHNWYTVYNELKIISKQSGDDFPLVFIHDIAWPYGRRDLYYNPNNIPTAYLNEYKQEAIDVLSDELSNIGLNGHLNNAVEVDTERNGVLTAVEDFINQSSLEFDLIKIPAFHGLGILFESNEKIKNIIESIIEKSNISQILEKFYLNVRVNLNHNVEVLRNRVQELEKLNAESSEKIKSQDVEISDFRNRVQEIEKLNAKYCVNSKSKDVIHSDCWNRD